LSISFSFILGGAFISEFVAKSDSDNIILSWRTTTEDNIKHFEILRGSDKDNLTLITTINPKGDNSYYTFIDENAYKTSDSFYAYGLVIVDLDGTKSDIMHTRTFHDNVSSVKRTWGSIKALFR
jgi:hypothetical protein